MDCPVFSFDRAPLLGIGEEDPKLWEYAKSGLYKTETAYGHLTPEQYYKFILDYRRAQAEQRAAGIAPDPTPKSAEFYQNVVAQFRMSKSPNPVSLETTFLRTGDYGKQAQQKNLLNSLAVPAIAAVGAYLMFKG